MSTSACADDGGSIDPTNSAQGELDYGVFIYRCSGVSDAACIEDDEPSFPDAIGVGGSFIMDFAKDDNEDVTPTVRASSDYAVTSAPGGVFTLELAGEIAMLAVGPGGSILDFRHLSAAQPSDVRLWRDDLLVGPVADLGIGEEADFWVTPHDTSGRELAGSLSKRTNVRTMFPTRT
jgi:hypothetical protein